MATVPSEDGLAVYTDSPGRPEDETDGDTQDAVCLT